MPQVYDADLTPKQVDRLLGPSGVIVDLSPSGTKKVELGVDYEDAEAFLEVAEILEDHAEDLRTEYVAATDGREG